MGAITPAHTGVEKKLFKFCSQFLSTASVDWPCARKAPLFLPFTVVIQFDSFIDNEGKIIFDCTLLFFAHSAILLIVSLFVNCPYSRYKYFT